MPETKSKPAESPSITVHLDAKFHNYILNSAKEDDRTPAKWLKRYIQGHLDADIEKGK